MSQKQINHIIDYTNKFTKDIDMNIQFIIEENDGNSNNYGKINNIALDVVNSKNTYYLKNISLYK